MAMNNIHFIKSMDAIIKNYLTFGIFIQRELSSIYLVLLITKSDIIKNINKGLYK